MSIIMLWAILVVGLLVFELISMELYGGCLAIASIGGLLAAIFELSVIWQILIAVVVAAILIVLVRPIAYKYVKQIKKESRVQRLVGADAVVVRTIDNSKGVGMVTINGQTWAAKSHRPNAVIATGQVVKVVAMSKTMAIVDDKKRNNA